MFRILLLSLIFVSNVASASCVIDALKQSGLDPFAVSYSTTNGFPNDNGQVEIVVEIRGSTYGNMKILCDVKTDTFLSFVSEYQEIGQY